MWPNADNFKLDTGFILNGIILCYFRPIYLSIYGSIAFCWTLASFSIYSSICTVGMTPWTWEQPPVARPLPTHRTTQTQNNTKKLIPQLGFEPTISVFEQSNSVNALDRADTVIGNLDLMMQKKKSHGSIIATLCANSFGRITAMKADSKFEEYHANLWATT
jgi:hypothetical protein